MLEMSGKWAVRVFERETKTERRHSNLLLFDAAHPFEGASPTDFTLKESIVGI